MVSNLSLLEVKQQIIETTALALYYGLIGVGVGVAVIAVFIGLAIYASAKAASNREDDE